MVVAQVIQKAHDSNQTGFYSAFVLINNSWQAKRSAIEFQPTIREKVMKFRYKFLLFILLLALPALACGEDAASTSTSRSNSVEILSPTPESPSSTPTSESTPTPKPTLPIVTIKGARVNIRSGPGTNYPVIQTLDQNATAPATGFNSGQTWVQIELPDSAPGWVSADLVDIDNSDEISIVTNISPAPVATTSSQQPPSSENNGGSSGGNSGGNTENPFQCVGGCATAPDPSCTIKGNVNSSGEKIYHTLGGAFYARTDIKPEEGDRWFCNIAEAEAAGFRPSSR